MAKKKPFHQRKKRRLKNTLKAQTQNKLMNEMKEAMGKDIRFKTNEGEKMSDVLTDFIKPFRDDYNHSADQLKFLCQIAMVAWNETIDPRGRPDDLIEALSAHLSVNDANAFRNDLSLLLDDLMTRKKKHFAHNQRLMLGVEIVDLGDDFYIQVVSTPNRAK